MRNPDHWTHRFKVLKAALAHEVLEGPDAGRFEEAAARQPALAAYSSVAAVLGAMADESPRRAAEQEGLARAVIEEFQAGSGTYWSSVALLAYLPLAGHVRARLADSGIPDEELDSVAIEAVLKAAATIDVGAGSRLTSLRMRQTAMDLAFAVVNAERRQRAAEAAFAPADDTEARDWTWPNSRKRRGRVVDREEAETMVSLLKEWAGDLLTAPEFTLLATTIAWRERLWDYVGRTQPSLPLAARIRAVARLKRERSRILERLRPILRDRGIHPDDEE